MATISAATRDALEADLSRLARVLVRALLFVGLAVVLVLLLPPIARTRAPRAVYGMAAGALGLLAVSLVQVPVSAFWLAAIRGRRGLLSDQLQMSACIGGLAVTVAGAVVALGTGLPAGATLGWLMVALGAAGTMAGLRRRWAGLGPFTKSTPWGLVAGVPLFLLLSAYGSYYQGQGENDVRRALRYYSSWQGQQSEAHGRYAAAPDSTFELVHGVVLVETRLTPDGYVARARLVGEEAACAVYVGGTPAPPARIELEPACTPLPNRTLLVVGIFYLATAALVTALVAWRMASVRKVSSSDDDA